MELLVEDQISIEQAYGVHYQDNKELINDKGWLRLCIKTSSPCIRQWRKENHLFDCMTRPLTSLNATYESYIRPKVLAYLK